MPNTPLNPDALEASAKAASTEQCECECWLTEYEACDSCKSEATNIVSAYLVVAQPVATNAEGLLGTRAGIALANTAFQEGMNAGIRACNRADADRPFVKPVSPYSAPLLAMIKADRPEVKP